MKYFSLIIIFFFILGCSDSGQTAMDVKDINVPQKLTAADIVQVIKNGSNKYGSYALGPMPANLLEDKDAEEVAEYIIHGMKGEKPVSFKDCASCHAGDGMGFGKGSDRYSPSLFGPNLNKKACVDGNSNECISIGDAFKKGAYVEKNITKAIAFYNEACSNENYEGCFKLADIYDSVYGFEDYDKAYELYEDICDADYYEGCMELGHAYMSGLRIKTSLSKAIEAYKKACDGSYYKGCISLADTYVDYQTKSKEPISKAIETYQKVCDGNSYEGCIKLADIYMHRPCKGDYYDNCAYKSSTWFSDTVGKEVTKNISKAVELYKKACDNNYYEACLGLGRAYLDKPEKAIKVYEKVCRVDDKYIDSEYSDVRKTRAQSCVILANMYETGLGVDKNMTLSNKFHIKGCEGATIDMFCLNRDKNNYKDTTPTKNVYPASNSSGCESLKSKFLDCVHKSYLGLPCKPGTDIVLPPRCR